MLWLPFNGDIDQAVAALLPSATDDAVKIAAAELLAMRKATANLNSVLELIKVRLSGGKRRYLAGFEGCGFEGDLVNCVVCWNGGCFCCCQQAVSAAISSISSQTTGNDYPSYASAGDSKNICITVNNYNRSTKDALATIVDGSIRKGVLFPWCPRLKLLNWRYRGCRRVVLVVVMLPRLLISTVPWKLESVGFKSVLYGENRFAGAAWAMEITRTDEQKSLFCDRSNGQVRSWICVWEANSSTRNLNSKASGC